MDGTAEEKAGVLAEPAAPDEIALADLGVTLDLDDDDVDHDAQYGGGG